MRRYFNTEGLCDPEEHYMVRLDDRLDSIKNFFVDRGKYFIINRGRQYGKTTTLRALAEYLRDDYLVISMDFQMMSASSFGSEKKFVDAFIKHFVSAVKSKADSSAAKEVADLEMKNLYSIDELFIELSKFCQGSKRPVIMMIDDKTHIPFGDFSRSLRY